MRRSDRGGRLAGAVGLALLAAALAGPGIAASAEPIETPGPGLMRHFSLFHTPAEQLPEDLARIFSGAEGLGEAHPNPSSCFGMNGGLAQRLPTRVNILWVVPGDGCVYVMSTFGRTRTFPLLAGSASTDVAVRHGLQVGKAGLVPDGVIAVRLSRTLTVPVTDNTYLFTPGSYNLTPDQVKAIWRRPLLIHGATASGR
jgi:hypothetical protein